MDVNVRNVIDQVTTATDVAYTRTFDIKVLDCFNESVDVTDRTLAGTTEEFRFNGESGAESNEHTIYFPKVFEFNSNEA